VSRNFRIIFFKDRDSWLVYPVPPQENLKYLIEARAEADAVRIAQSIVDGRLKPPLEDTTRYEAAELHTDGSTLIFRVKSTP
jgi:hypothetical protein